MMEVTDEDLIRFYEHEIEKAKEYIRDMEILIGYYSCPPDVRDAVDVIMGRKKAVKA